MAEPRVFRAEAVVLRQRRLGEADRILTLYTPYRGRLEAVARGVLKPTSHLAGHLEPLTYVSLLLARGRELAIVTQAQALEAFPRLRGDLNLLGLACYACELVDRLTALGQADPPVFYLLLEALRRLGRPGDLEAGPSGERAGPEAAATLRCLEAGLLAHLGYGPELFRCLGCQAGHPTKSEISWGPQAALPPHSNGFSPAAGGVLCPSCAAQDPQARPLSLNALKVLRLWQRQGFAAPPVRLSGALARELEEHLRRYLLHVLEREMRSRAFLEAIGRG